ncbi:MAG: ABC transporter substrate-binding protein [Acidimicrobiales bacterium]|nr:ABC transporter substrate-binding protein [Acidimicrobiales bacterium]
MAMAGVSVAAGGTPAPKKASSPTKGGTLSVLTASGYATWPSLDPAADTQAVADGLYYDAIYGGLFAQGPKGQIQPDLATSWSFSNGGLTYTMNLRQGVKFSDGTPFNAAAVAFNLNRDLNPAGTNGVVCACLPNFPVKSVSTPGPYTVQLTLTHPYAPLAYAWFDETPNWIVSPTALQSEGESTYMTHPVGAGPFQVASDVPGTKLTLKKNPNYWQSGHPYLDGITFSPVGSDTSGYDSLLSGQNDVYLGYSTLPNIKVVKQHVQTVKSPDTLGPLVVQLNTAIPPFNNQTAREALYYAMNVNPIQKSIAAGLGTPDESMGVPGGLYYQKHVPGYKTFNLKKAKALVKQLGGLSFTLGTISLGSATNTEIDSVLQSQFQAAGMHVTLHNDPSLAGLIQTFHGGKWQAELQTAGGFDPALGVGLAFRYLSTAPFTGIHDPQLDAMINQAATITNPQQATSAYSGIWKYIAQKAYSPFLYTTPGYILSTHSIKGPGISSTGWEIGWANLSKSA